MEKAAKGESPKSTILFAKLADELGLDKLILHTKVGKAEKVIPFIANKLKVRMVMVGTVGRNGIQGKLIGNTAERVCTVYVLIWWLLNLELMLLVIMSLTSNHSNEIAYFFTLPTQIGGD